MRKLAILAGAVSLFAGVPIAQAADHLFTAVAAGGLSCTSAVDPVLCSGTSNSQPFLNGVNNPGRPGDDVPGQGSPLSGNDHTVPATDKHPEATRVPPPVGSFTVPRGK